MLKIAVFGSGRGSNFEAILGAIQTGAIHGARIVLVVSNKSDTGILSVARMNAIPALHMSERQFNTEEEFVARTLDVLRAHGVNFIVLAGYMKRLPSRIIEVFRNRIINIHPALLPKFGGPGMYGMHVHEAVIASGETISGATVHVVDEEYDHGPIVLQREVRVSANDTPESLAAKVLAVEHQVYPEAIRMFAEGKVIIPNTEVAVHPS
jgi:phosphoribosylglycinamide formyltransferase-1